MGWVLLQLFCWQFYTKYFFLYFEHLQMVSSTMIHAIDLKTYRQDGRVVWGAGLKHWCKAPVTSVALVRVDLQSFCWHCCTKYCFLYFKHFQMVSPTIMNASWFESNSSYFVDIPIQSMFPLCWTPAHDMFYHHSCYWPYNIQQFLDGTELQYSQKNRNHNETNT